MEIAFHLLRAIVYASGFVLLWGWLALTVRRFDPVLGLTLPLWLGPVGFAVLGAGALLALTCIAGFAVWGAGTPAPFDAPRRFVARGPYRYVRNPMYVGAFGVLVGYGLVVHSPAVLLLALVMLGCAHLFVVLYEERTLERRFGEEYRVYRRAVQRWRPGPAAR